jgi:hypothetical protein
VALAHWQLVTLAVTLAVALAVAVAGWQWQLDIRIQRVTAVILNGGKCGNMALAAKKWQWLHNVAVAVTVPISNH